MLAQARKKFGRLLRTGRQLFDDMDPFFCETLIDARAAKGTRIARDGGADQGREDKVEAAPPRDARLATPGLSGRLVAARGLLYVTGAWRHYEHHPALEDSPKTTRTAQGIPGDPLNVGLVGSESDVVHAMLRAGWNPADPITFESSVKIAASVVFRRPDPDAPVSSLYLFGRRQDLAFEKPVGHDVRRRHHVRFWKSPDLGDLRPPLFIGSATFDVRVGFSHDTGQITHHISPDIDAERDGLIADLVGGGPREDLPGDRGRGDSVREERRTRSVLHGR